MYPSRSANIKKICFENFLFFFSWFTMKKIANFYFCRKDQFDHFKENNIPQGIEIGTERLNKHSLNSFQRNFFEILILASMLCFSTSEWVVCTLFSESIIYKVLLFLELTVHICGKFIAGYCCV